MDGTGLTDFNDFLAQESFGGELESSSSFTISKEKALEKLAQMNLGDPDEWVLKMVQASVAANCEKLSFKLGRLTTQVEFFGGEFNLRPIKEALLDPNSSSDSFCSELIIGLRALLFRAEFRLKTGDGSWFALKGKDLRESEQPEETSDRLTVMVANEFALAIRQRANYLQLLKNRALFSSVPIFVDSRPLLPVEILAATPPDFTANHPRLTAPLLYAKFHLDEILSEQDLSKAKGGIMTDPLRSLEYFLHRSGDPGFSANQGHLHLAVDYGRAARQGDLSLRAYEFGDFDIAYTRLGVVSRTETLSTTLVGALHLPADEARSDLSGLRIQEVPKRSLRVLTPYFHRLEQEILGHRSRPHRYAIEWGRVSAGFAMLGGAVGVSLLPFGLASLTAAKIIAVAGSIGGSTQMSWDALTEELRSDITTDLRKLRRELGV